MPQSEPQNSQIGPERNVLSSIEIQRQTIVISIDHRSNDQVELCPQTDAARNEYGIIQNGIFSDEIYCHFVPIMLRSRDIRSQTQQKEIEIRISKSRTGSKAVLQVKIMRSQKSFDCLNFHRVRLRMKCSMPLPSARRRPFDFTESNIQTILMRFRCRF